MNVVIVGSGPVEELPDFATWPDAVFIGVDAGTLVLLERGILPKAAVGDFDSVSQSQLEEIAAMFPDFNQAEEAKDETDTELALEKAVGFSPLHVYVVGVTGGRLDHYMSALHAVYHVHLKHPEVRFSIVNKQNRIRFLEPGVHKIQREDGYRFISFYPFAEEIEGFTLKNFKYPVVDETIRFGSTRFVSNEFSDEGIVSFSKGSCIVIESVDM